MKKKKTDLKIISTETTKPDNVINFPGYELRVRCVEERKNELENETLVYNYTFITELEEDENPITTPITTLTIENLTSQKYEVQKNYYFKLYTKLRD